MAVKRKPKSIAQEGTPGEGGPIEKEARERCNQLLATLQGFSPEEALRIKRELGIVIPIRMTVHSDSRRWKYRCNQCQGICLEFKGEQFVHFHPDQETMVVSDSPPLDVPLEELPWVSPGSPKKGPGTVHDLRCPSCGMKVALRADRSLVNTLIVESKGTPKPVEAPKTRPGRVSLRERAAMQSKTEGDDA